MPASKNLSTSLISGLLAGVFGLQMEALEERRIQ
jgi:hypothetical protein